MTAAQAEPIRKSLTDEKRAHLFILGNAAISDGGEVTKNAPGVSGHDLLVRIRQGTTMDDLQRSIEAQGGEVLNKKPVGEGMFQLQVEAPGKGIRIFESIRGDKNVVSVEKNQTIRPQDQP